MRKKIVFFILTVLFLFNLSYADELNIPVKEYTLDNGLKVLIVERHNAPVFSANILFKVGAVNDPVGLTGAAHMLEHMMFKGTKIIGTTNYKAEVSLISKIKKLIEERENEKAKGISNPSAVDIKKIERIEKEIAVLESKEEKYAIPYEIWSIYEKNGASGLNAYTSNDRTCYVVSLPSNKLDLWAFLESDRLKNPVFRIFDAERKTIGEERKQTSESDPQDKLYEEFMATMYQAIPYHNPVIGWPKDIENYTPEDIMGIFKRNYSPKNMIIAIVGDVKPKEVMNIIKKYFGGMTNYGRVKPIFTQEIPQKNQRILTLKEDTNPEILIGFHGPLPVSKDCYVLDVISEIMSSGKTSRLYKDLIEDKKMATRVSFENQSLKYEDAVFVSVNPAKGVDLKLLEEEIFKQIDKLKNEKISQWELQKAKNKLTAKFIRSIEDNSDLAEKLAENEGSFGSWRLFDLRKEYEKVTADDIQKVAQKYLNKDNSTVAELVSSK